MLTLGIWAFGRDSSAVLVNDSSTVAAVEEEKLSRSTGMGGILRMAISRCLDRRNAKITDVQLDAFPRRPALSAIREAGVRLRNVFSGCTSSASALLLPSSSIPPSIFFREPLVSDPREAIRSFYGAGIDAPAIGEFFIVK